MKNHIFRAIAIFAIFLAFAMASVEAQTASRVEIQIPFEFSAEKTTLKPGAYTIKRMTGNLVQLKSVDGTSVILNAPVNLSSTDYEATERLVFNKHGHEYSLAQIWLTADSGRELSRKNKAGKSERIELSLRVSPHVE
jgi:hypothetical protein